jgi:hypothetical protein
MLDLTVLVPRLKQVIAWTAHRAQHFDYQNGNYGTVFRHLNPLIKGKPLFTNNAGYTTWNQDVYELEFLKQALGQALAQRAAQVVEPGLDLANFQLLGRILYFETQTTTHDGVATAESQCFVDESDMPPIDTWFYFDEGKRNLFCWIPRQFEEVMQKAVDAEIFDSYHWLDKEGPMTHASIVAAMLS